MFDQLSRFDAVLFDLDGTLVEFARPYASFTNELTDLFGVPDRDSFLERYHAGIMSDGPVTFRSSLASAFAHSDLALPPNFEILVEQMVVAYGSGVMKLSHTDELLRATEHLGRAIVSNGPSDMQRAALRSTGIDSEFEAILVSGDADVATRKPSREIFLLACERLGVEPGKVVMVGDNQAADIDGAIAAGLNAIHIRDLIAK